MTFDRPKTADASCSRGSEQSELSHFPIKLQLLNPAAPFLKGSDLLLLADCAAAAYPGLHAGLLRGRTVAMGCPKLDDIDELIARLTAIVSEARPRSITVAVMEVPCCSGLVHAAHKALQAAGTNMPLHRVIISRDGKLIRREELKACND